jgi:hypothetical protein
MSGLTVQEKTNFWLFKTASWMCLAAGLSFISLVLILGKAPVDSYSFALAILFGAYALDAKSDNIELKAMIRLLDLRSSDR